MLHLKLLYLSICKTYKTIYILTKFDKPTNLCNIQYIRTFQLIYMLSLIRLQHSAWVPLSRHLLLLAL